MADLANLIKGFLSNIWQMFSIEIPVFGFSYQELFIGTMVADVGIAVLILLFGVGKDKESYRSSSTKNPRISKERRNDTK